MLSTKKVFVCLIQIINVAPRRTRLCEERKTNRKDVAAGGGSTRL